MQEFFKPNKGKIVITITFVLLAIFGFINFGHTCPIQLRGEPPCTQPLIAQISDVSGIIFGTDVGLNIASFLQFGNTGENLISIVMTIFAILIGLAFVMIYNYILASIIFTIYHKFKK